MSENDPRDAEGADVELHPETLQDLDVVEGSDEARGGLAPGKASNTYCC